MVFDIVCAITYLPYFLQYFCALLHSLLLLQCSLLHIVDVCRLLAVLLPRFGQSALTLDSFFFVTHTLIDMHLVPFTLIYCVVEFLLFVLARFLLTFFSM